MEFIYILFYYLQEKKFNNNILRPYKDMDGDNFVDPSNFGREGKKIFLKKLQKDKSDRVEKVTYET